VEILTVLLETVPPEIAAINRPREELLTYYFLTALATTIAFPITMAVLYFRYHTMRFQFDPEGLRMSWGIIFRNQVMLNYARIQDIHLRSNLFERWLGLARIEVQTASGASGSTVTLEGMPDPAAMRDFLYSRMRGAPSKDDPLATVLTEIAAELHAIRQHFEVRRG
jgi:putative membrane protein